MTDTCSDLPSSAYSMIVRQLELSTFCAGSCSVAIGFLLIHECMYVYARLRTCPVARKTAVTMLAACALNPPMEPAVA